MKCTDKEWKHCRVEKMTCKGCYYEDGSGTNVGSIEKDVNYLENMIKEFNMFGDLNNPEYEDTATIMISIENILKEREQDKARIKELECEKWKTLSVQKLSENKANSIKIENQVIPKYIIRNEINEIKNDKSHKWTAGTTVVVLQVLEELLENKGE